ncbi:EAL domain-containing protein [Demequina sp. TTPB684]|uniref:putative bifunctional diguanylate cyclase/phosphodiesterase n=1 Tax=unclassified Demequina TaxID=2620311 RepID=UPI001CF4A9EA|nr:MULTISPECIES: EAL domain-containing protein [unclassified Demequina]MCB2411829.1 EAL domain-containing protein [Demequina sp. TTPB684]UPU88957.1 EAL domain-containing protein [Demequina sp. TMPB413]
MATRNDLFGLTFRDSPIGMVIMDTGGRYIEVNEAFARIVGRSASELENRHFAEYTHPDDLPRDVELMNRLASGEVPFYQVHKRILHCDGDTIWVRVTVSDVVTDDGSDHHYVAQVEDVTEVRRARDLLERRALYDHLTGLANRTLLMERLEQTLDSHEPRAGTVACIFLDVDHFKVVNDSLGHDSGDIMLVEIARRIQGAVRAADTVARLGGDEFVIVVEDVMGLDAAKSVLNGIAAAVSQPFHIDSHELAPSVSGGLAMASPGVTAESLVRNADMAMCAAKQGGRGRVEVFNDSMRETALTKLSIESELRCAIREGELVVHYQPVVDLETQDIVAFEALVRWQHPVRGLLLPDEFIPISEDANLVVPLGSVVLHEACEFLAARPNFAGRVFVNVSTRQIGTADLARVVRSALDTSGASPHQLGLEITESGMLLATASARADLKALTDLGVDLILDDFGTGYSALSSVLQNPVSGLKLAREFTLRLGDRGTGDRISTAMAALTRSLNLYGVIEGIETEAQFSIARRHGWQLGQGFLFGHAVPAEQITLGLPRAATESSDAASSARDGADDGATIDADGDALPGWLADARPH